MAVTQQLARLPQELFDECRRDVGVLTRLLSFDLIPPERHLDLGWSSRGLELLARACNPDHGRAIALALEGGIKPLNSGLAADTVEIAPCGLAAEDVRAVSAQLVAIDPSDLMARWPQVSAAVERAIGRTDDAPAYFSRQFELLRTFYAAAAKGSEATIMWWD